MKVCRSLSEKLTNIAQVYGMTVNEAFLTFLFNVPDEALREYHALADPVEMELSEEAEGVAASMAEDFGLTPLGLTVLLDQILDKALKSFRALKEHEARVGN